MKELSRVCKQCGKTQPIVEFYFYNKKKQIRRRICKSCHVKQVRLYYQDNKAAKRDFQLQNKYGIDLGDAYLMEEEQGGKCALCDYEFKDDDFVVDHNHNTGKVRALLCQSCNITVGQFETNRHRITQILGYIQDGR